jgi:hypothetical protein
MRKIWTRAWAFEATNADGWKTFRAVENFADDILRHMALEESALIPSGAAGT